MAEKCQHNIRYKNGILTLLQALLSDRNTIKGSAPLRSFSMNDLQVCQGCLLCASIERVFSGSGMPHYSFIKSARSSDHTLTWSSRTRIHP